MIFRRSIGRSRYLLVYIFYKYVNSLFYHAQLNSIFRSSIGDSLIERNFSILSETRETDLGICSHLVPQYNLLEYYLIPKTLAPTGSLTQKRFDSEPYTIKQKTEGPYFKSPTADKHNYGGLKRKTRREQRRAAHIWRRVTSMETCAESKTSKSQELPSIARILWSRTGSTHIHCWYVYHS